MLQGKWWKGDGEVLLLCFFEGQRESLITFLTGEREKNAVQLEDSELCFRKESGSIEESVNSVMIHNKVCPYVVPTSKHVSCNKAGFPGDETQEEHLWQLGNFWNASFYLWKVRWGREKLCLYIPVFKCLYFKIISIPK